MPCPYLKSSPLTPVGQGFTLIEMAITLLIVTLLLGGLIVPLSAHVEQRKTTETQKTLDDSKEALIGFAIANGRLPCPASSTSNGVEDPIGGGTCTHPYDGFLPAVTLGIEPVDNQGFALDGWNSRIRYAVTNANANAFTSVNGIQSVINTTGWNTLSPNLVVCDSGAGMTSSGCGAGSSSLTTNAVAVVFSLGKNWATGGAGIDEAENTNGNRLFVSHIQSAATGNEFDDIVTWLSPNILYNRMVSAGRLP